MEKHMIHILKNYTKIFPSGPIDSDSLVGKRYSWGNGYIQFFHGSKLTTLWGPGSYNMLDHNTVLASWSGFNHVIKFDKALNNYISFRTEDLEICCGKQKAYPLSFYGDSHGIMMFQELKIQNTNMCDIGKTMFSMGRDTRILNFNPDDMDEKSTPCFVYGEVDVRCHIGKQVLLGRDLNSICKSLVSNYFKTIRTLVRVYKKIIVAAVPPPTDPADHTHEGGHHTPLPFIGTNAERLLYTNTLNANIKDFCLQYGYVYFDPYDPYKRGDGCLNYSLSDGCIHIGNTDHVHAEFAKIL
jgi:hypothetical protein